MVLKDNGTKEEGVERYWYGKITTHKQFENLLKFRIIIA